MEQGDAVLRYIAAEHVETPAGRLDGTVIVSPNDEPVGTLDGIVFDPAERRVRYFVVRSQDLAIHRHLVPAVPARLDAEHRTLHVNVNPDDLPQLREVQSDTFAQYSDDDLLSALFSASAA